MPSLCNDFAGEFALTTSAIIAFMNNRRNFSHSIWSEIFRFLVEIMVNL